MNVADDDGLDEHDHDDGLDEHDHPDSRSPSMSKGARTCGLCRPAASSVDDLVSRAQADGWVVQVIATPMGKRFIDAAWLAEMTGDRVRDRVQDAR